MNKMKEYREKFGYSQRDLATMMNLSQGQYWKLETGKSLLNVNQIFQLCKIYNCTPNDILVIQGLHSIGISKLDKN